MIFAGFECYNCDTPELLGSYSDVPPNTGLRPVPETDNTTIQRSYRLRFYPNATQRLQLSQCFGISRFAYNCSLDAMSFAYRTQGQSFSTIDCNRALTEVAKDADFEWLKDAPKTVITSALRNLDKAFKNFFAGRAKHPNFKKKMHKQTATFQLDQRKPNWLSGRMLKLPKVGGLNIKWSRIPTGRPKMATVTRTASGKYFVSFMCEEAIERYPATGKTCGMDAGCRSLASTQDWQSGAPKYTAKYARQLKLAQRHLARKTKGSTRWHIQRIKVARIHEKIANSRNDFLHKVSSYLVKNHDEITIQELHVAGMKKNRSLAKTVSDAAMAELHRQTQYKSGWYGRKYTAISRWEKTSGVCTDCGTVNDIGSAEHWTCDCGKAHNRDQASAEIIERVGLTGESVSTGVEYPLSGAAIVAA